MLHMSQRCQSESDSLPFPSLEFPFPPLSICAHLLANKDPGQLKQLFHSQEMSQLKSSPARIVFFCEICNTWSKLDISIPIHLNHSVLFFSFLPIETHF